MKNLNAIKLFTLTLFAVIFATACSSKKSKAEVNLPTFEVEQPEIKSVVHTFDYPGYTESKAKVELVARVSGYIESVNYEPGAFVQKGALLFVIEPKPYQDKLDKAEADVKSCKAALRMAEENLKRVKEAAMSKAVSEMDVIKAETNLDQAQANLKSAMAQASLAQRDLEYCYNRAPFSGRVSYIIQKFGDSVNNTKGEVLATIYDDSQIYVYFNVEDKKYLYLLSDEVQRRKNQKYFGEVSVIFGEDKQSYTFRGFLDYMSPNIDLNTGTFILRAVVENKKQELKSGLFVTVKLPYEKLDSAILVHEASVGSDQTGRYMYVLTDSNTVKYRSVKVGVGAADMMVEITEGLEPSDWYINKAILKVRDGMKISPNKIK